MSKDKSDCNMETKEYAEQISVDSNITLHLMDGYDKSLAPVKPERLREWWEESHKTVNHAKFCLPLVMGNSIGYIIRSPATFTVEWDGSENSDSAITISDDRASHTIIDNHSTHGGFTVQAGFVARTKNVGDFVYIKNVPNTFRQPFYVLEAAIEAWWNPAIFGIVALLNQPGKFTVQKGQPLAHMVLLKASGANADLDFTYEKAPHYDEWHTRRSREDYHGKDLDYLQGRLPLGEVVCPHFKRWHNSIKDGEE